MESENKVFAFLEKYLMGPMGKVASFRIVRAIMAAGMACIPFTIVGSIDPTIVKGIHAIPAAIIALTILNEATFPIGPIKYFSKNANTLFSDSIKRPLFYVNS